MSFFRKGRTHHGSAQNSSPAFLKHQQASADSFVHLILPSDSADHTEMDSAEIARLLEEHQNTSFHKTIEDAFPSLSPQIREEEEIKEMLSYLTKHEIMDEEQLKTAMRKQTGDE